VTRPSELLRYYETLNDFTSLRCPCYDCHDCMVRKFCGRWAVAVAGTPQDRYDFWNGRITELRSKQ
jgi:hypothetical protein